MALGLETVSAAYRPEASHILIPNHTEHEVGNVQGVLDGASTGPAKPGSYLLEKAPDGVLWPVIDRPTRPGACGCEIGRREACTRLSPQSCSAECQCRKRPRIASDHRRANQRWRRYLPLHQKTAVGQRCAPASSRAARTRAKPAVKLPRAIGFGQAADRGAMLGSATFAVNCVRRRGWALGLQFAGIRLGCLPPFGSSSQQPRFGICKSLPPVG